MWSTRLCKLLSLLASAVLSADSLRPALSATEHCPFSVPLNDIPLKVHSAKEAFSIALFSFRFYRSQFKYCFTRKSFLGNFSLKYTGVHTDTHHVRVCWFSCYPIHTGCPGAPDLRTQVNPGHVGAQSRYRQGELHLRSSKRRTSSPARPRSVLELDWFQVPSPPSKFCIFILLTKE